MLASNNRHEAGFLPLNTGDGWNWSGYCGGVVAVVEWLRVENGSR